MNKPESEMVLVPREPTEAMLHAAVTAWKHAQGTLASYMADRCAYRAMLAASPQAVPSEQPIAEQPQSDKSYPVVAVGSDLPPARPEWRRIGTAPRDGTNILLRFGEDGVSQGKFVPGLAHPWKFIDTNDGITWLINHAVDGPGGPSHWQPMPSSARPVASTSAVPSEDLQTALPEAHDIEAVIACLGDDAAQLRDENPEDERAANMDDAAALLQKLAQQNAAVAKLLLAQDREGAKAWARGLHISMDHEGGLTAYVSEARVEPVVGPLSGARSDLPSMPPPAASLPVSAPAGVRDPVKFFWENRPTSATQALHDVMAERYRQMMVEGWTAKHDDEHGNGAMAFAAAAYAVSSTESNGSLSLASKLFWHTGWAKQWWKPKTPRADLVRATTLLLAEIERLDRAAMSATTKENP